MMKNIDWENAINLRRSTRSFDMRPVEEFKVSLLQKFTKQMEVPIEHDVKVQFFKANPDKKLYTVFTSPPDNVGFITNTDTCSISKAGFVGELVILYATTLGLATCWYGHYTLAELERLMPHLGKYADLPNPKWGYGKDEVEGERVICTSPLGYWKQEGVRLVDRIQTSFFSHKRKPIADLMEKTAVDSDGTNQGDGRNDYTKYTAVEKFSEEILYALDLARKAPSGANSQHWRFHVSSDSKIVTIAMPVGYKHVKWEHPNVDIGICACHFWLGLMMKNLQSKVSLREDQGRAVWTFRLQP